LWSELRDGLVDRFLTDHADAIAAAEADIDAGRALPSAAAAKLLDDVR
jgi:hypothetical protein